MSKRAEFLWPLAFVLLVRTPRACLSSNHARRIRTAHLCPPIAHLIRYKNSPQKNQMKVCPACDRKFPDSMTLCSADAAVLKRLEDPLIGKTLAGKYRIEQLIKTGG